MKMFRILSATLASALLLTSTVSWSQPEIGSRIDRSKEGMTGYHDPLVQQSPRAGLNAMMRCEAENNRSRATDTLSYPYMSDEQTKSLSKIFKKVQYDGRCSLAKDIRYSISTGPVAGSFAEFFLLRKYGENEVAALATLTDLDWQKEYMLPRNANEFFGRCVVRSSRNNIYALIGTVPETEQESAAIKAIVPSLGPCVTDGLEVKFDKTSLRTLLAYSLYRAVHQHEEMMEKAE